MGIGRPAVSSWVLLTGATGFVGQCLVEELLDRGHRILAIVRAGAPAEARTRLAAALKPWGRDIEPYLESGRLAVLRGNVNSPRLGIDRAVFKRLRGSVRSVVHAAGNTTFRRHSDGEPTRTNVDGTREVFRLARACECLDWHLISTAYVCGKSEGSAEQLLPEPPAFRNEYEQSKWLAEAESTRAAADCAATLTIYRPSVVVGHSRSGVAARFVGGYYLFRATSLMAQAVAQRQDVDRRRIPLRICADPASRPNLVFVDDVVRDFADVFENQEAHGGVYHLIHPAPPSNRQIKNTLERYYDIGGGRFVGGATPPPAGERSLYEEIFGSMTDGIAEYIFDSPRFDRRCLDQVVTRRATRWTSRRLRSLIDYAESVGWRQGRTDADPHAELDGFAAYFEDFLPQHVERSKIGRLSQLSVDVRFHIAGGLDGDWWCRFRHGKVDDVRRTGGRSADVIYRTTPIAFWRAVAGEVTGAELFLSGDATLEGDIERGLKFAMILEEFVREASCDREKLLTDAARTQGHSGRKRPHSR